MFNQTIYRIVERQPDAPNYLHFIGWVYLWAAILHWITAALNCTYASYTMLAHPARLTSAPPHAPGCNFLKYVTLFSCDTFGFYVSWVYLQYGVQVLTRQLPSPPSSSSSPTSALDGALVSIILALLMLLTAALFRAFARSALAHRHARRFAADYGMPLALVAASALAYWGRFDAAHPATLPVRGAFEAAGGRAWLVRFWELDGKWVGVALPFGLVLWVLFFFDHNVSVRPFPSLPICRFHDER